MHSSDPAGVLKQSGTNINAERARREMTEEALANESGGAVAQVARMERGECDTDLSKFTRLAHALNVKPALLLKDVD